MGIENYLNGISITSSSLIHLTMITSIVAAALSTTQSSGSSAEDSILINQQRPAIPYCDNNQERTIGRRLLYVTTLDGRLSALDISKGGKLRWSIATGPGPLVSSSIHRLELTNNGQFVRMIPSLSGGIYKFDGESIDPIPITTENLLSSSAKFSDDLVISGGKETRTYGVCVRTGNLLYECSMHGCINSTNADRTQSSTVNNRMEDAEELYLSEHDPLVDDVLVVRRQTQTVRAVESRTGTERWNFSVGQHELNIMKSSECHERDFSEMDIAVLDLDFRVIVPEGIVCAFRKSDPSTMLWKYKFDHPIVSSWKSGESDELESIDMFSSAQWLWDTEENIFDPPYPSASPSIYLGMYDKQLYIQESVNLRKEILDQSNLYTHLTTESLLPKIPWRPIPASSNSLVIFQDDNTIREGALAPSPTDIERGIQGNELVPYREGDFALSAQSVLNASEFVNGNGFYLYTREDLNETDNVICNDATSVPAIEAAPQSETNTTRTIVEYMDFSLDDIDAPVKVVILSLWFWWKEILVIAITSAVVLNLLLGQRNRSEREIVVIERHVPVPTAMEATEASTAALLGPTNGSSKSANGFLNGHRSTSESTTHSGEHFSSRFLSDFDLMRCLGRGGFGVVFEAKNKLDDCKYAVKRITLPNKKESRERVMREVKTLANCEHHNIVRYFQAWVETPPPGWQEEEDSKWMQHEMSTSIQIETPDGTTFPSFVSDVLNPHQMMRHIQNEKKKQLISWVSNITNTACSEDFENNANKINEEDDDDDSCIVFRSESQSMALKEEEAESNDSCFESNKTESQLMGTTKLNQTDTISIDIHSNSFHMAKNGKTKIDYSQLSDSFQIEFVRSMDEDGEPYIVEEKSNAIKKSNTDSKLKNKQQHLLDVTQESNNNCKALIPALMASTPKPIQNKVYLYIQMQLCRKECLRDWLRENRREARENHIASIFHQIVDAVDYVHLKGLIHRDLKPSNIFFSQDGQIKIGDFGLVTDMSDLPNLVTKCGDKSGLPSCSRHTQQVGTHLYMSPEQLHGKHYDHRVDIYSLGLIFFELLVYFTTEMERVVTLRDLRDGRYPKDFPIEHPSEYELLKQMLSTNPEDRPATPELKIQLSSILKLPELVGDGEVNALAAAARILSRSRTISTSE